MYNNAYWWCLCDVKQQHTAALLASIVYVQHLHFIEVLSSVQIFHDEDDELPEAEVENVLALQGADEDDTDSDGSDALDRSDSDASSDESDAEDE